MYDIVINGASRVDWRKLRYQADTDASSQLSYGSGMGQIRAGGDMAEMARLPPLPPLERPKPSPALSKPRPGPGPRIFQTPVFLLEFEKWDPDEYGNFQNIFCCAGF